MQEKDALKFFKQEKSFSDQEINSKTSRFVLFANCIYEPY